MTEDMKLHAQKIVDYLKTRFPDHPWKIETSGDYWSAVAYINSLDG